MCHFFGASDVTGGCDEARRVVFELGKSLESLHVHLNDERK